MDKELIVNEYLQWLKDNKKMEYKLSDVFINKDGEIKIEKKMAWHCKNTWKDWEDFCKVKGIRYDGKVEILAIIDNRLCNSEVKNNYKDIMEDKSLCNLIMVAGLQLKDFNNCKSEFAKDVIRTNIYHLIEYISEKYK